MKVKVCGMTWPEQLQQLEDMPVDFAGFIFYEKSPRYAEGKMQKAKGNKQNNSLAKVGVFVNASLEDIKRAVEDYDLQFVQLHGEESPEFCNQVRQFVPVIKAFRISNESDIDAVTAPYAPACDYYLFDTATKLYGGSGEQFNWNLLQNAHINKPFFLSGGIGPEDIETIKKFQHPYLYAIDINSKFESSVGVKKMDVLQRFLNELANV